MEAEIAIYEKAIVEARELLAPRPGESAVAGYAIEANKVLQQAQQDTDAVRQMRSIAREEAKKFFENV